VKQEREREKVSGVREDWWGDMFASRAQDPFLQHIAHGPVTFKAFLLVFAVGYRLGSW